MSTSTNRLVHFPDFETSSFFSESYYRTAKMSNAFFLPMKDIFLPSPMRNKVGNGCSLKIPGPEIHRNEYPFPAATGPTPRHYIVSFFFIIPGT